MVHLTPIELEFRESLDGGDVSEPDGGMVVEGKVHRLAARLGGARGGAAKDEQEAKGKRQSRAHRRGWDRGRRQRGGGRAATTGCRGRAGECRDRDRRRSTESGRSHRPRRSERRREPSGSLPAPRKLIAHGWRP